MYIYDTARQMVVEHLAFQHTNKYQEWLVAGHPAWMSRRVALGGRRQMGFTTAAIKLAVEFAPSIIVVPKGIHIRHVTDTYSKIAGNRDIDIDVVQIDLLKSHLNKRSPSNPYKLAIFDEAALAADHAGLYEYNEGRAMLFQRATLVVEFQ